MVNHKSNQTKPVGVSGDFDLWLLALSWAPSFCCQKEKKKQCDQQRLGGANKLTIHGLWPSYATPRREGKSYPVYCELPPSGRINSESGEVGGLEQYEWLKHGTCSGLSLSQYFGEMKRHLSRPTPGNEEVGSREIRQLEKVLMETKGAVVEVTRLLQAFEEQKAVAVSATPKCQLKEITLCFSKAIDGTVGPPTACPKHLLKGQRNSAETQGCSYLVVDEATKCQWVTDNLLKQIRQRVTKKKE